MPVVDNKRFFPLVLLLAAFVAGFCILHYLYEDELLSAMDAFVSASVFAGCVWVGSSIAKNYPTHVAAIIYSIIIGISTGFVSYTVSGWLLQWWYEENPVFSHSYEASQFTRLLLHIISACWVISLGAMKRENDDLEEKMTHIADAATLHKEAELFKLRQQLQPHFLYNSLNSINALILILPEKAQEMVGKLSEFLRASVKRDAAAHIPLTEELQYIETYLAIESVRFGDRLHVAYQKQFNEDAVIPPFILQPILENAIKFGLYGTTGKVEINIDIAQQENLLQIKIENPYTETSKPSAGTGFGIEGIGRRLYLLYGRNDLLHTSQSESVFTTTLKLPQQDV